MQKTLNFNDVSIFSVKGKDYRIHFWYMSKDDATNIMQNSDLNEKSGLLKIMFRCINIRKNGYVLPEEYRKTIKSSK